MENENVSPLSESNKPDQATIMRESSFLDGFKFLQKRVNQTAHEKGWWKDRQQLTDAALKVGGHELEKFAKKAIGGMVLALIHSEVSEGLEGERKDLMSDHIEDYSMLEEEFADVIIRIMDYAEENELDVAGAVLAKLAFNDGREYKHGGKAF